MRLEGRTVWVQVRAGVDRHLRLLDPFGGADVEVSGAELRRETGFFEGDLAAGQMVMLRLAGMDLDLPRAIEAISQGGTTRFGLR